MDPSLIASSLTATFEPATRPSQPSVGAEGFAAAMESERATGSVDVDRVEGMVGARIRAPEGGCGCDALVDVATNSTKTTDRVTPTPVTDLPTTAVPTTALPTTDLPTAPARGQVVQLAGEGKDRDHQAIMRNTSEMIAVNQQGIVEVMAVPWARVTNRR